MRRTSQILSASKPKTPASQADLNQVDSDRGAAPLHLAAEDGDLPVSLGSKIIGLLPFLDLFGMVDSWSIMYNCISIFVWGNAVPSQYLWGKKTTKYFF